MRQLQITCLGDFQVMLAGEPLTAFPTDKARALLVYLAVEGQAQARSALTQFLWPGYSPESANNSLRQTIHRLRQLLHDTEGAPWLLITRQTVQINPAASIDIDVTTFTQLLAECAAHPHEQLSACPACLARLQRAVDLYRGDFLTGFTVADSDPFEEWRRVLQEQLHIQMLDALTQLASAAESCGDADGALRAAQRQLTLEPWLEAAHRQIMRVLANRGQRAAALAQYQRCREVLAEELGAEPDGETIALYEQIRNGQFPVARAATGTATPSLVPPSNQPAEHTQATPLPLQLAPLLGRSEELAQIVTLLAQPSCRLVTLVGPPGVGKTRLAQAIYDLQFTIYPGPTDLDAPNDQPSKIVNRNFEHGLHFIDLAALRDPTLLADTIAEALTSPENGFKLTGERLVEHLHDKEMLLVLDNFEQVLPAASFLGQLLTRCPRITVLTTSRILLQLPGERVVAVHPLPLPEPTASSGHPPQGMVTLSAVAQNAAVQLFCQRAALVVPGFVLTEPLAPVVVEICRRLDGLPLAIELAAARSRLLPPPALLARLTQDLPGRLQLLTSGSQTLPPRQQTLRAAIAWSYDLLDADEQRLFRQLAVFVGGASLVAIEAVLDAGTHAGQRGAPHPLARPLLDTIESLLDKSLLRQQEIPGGRTGAEPRIVMLETLREYGWERLAAADAASSEQDQSPQQRHADFFLAFAEASAPKLHGAAQVEWLDRLALEHDNLRAALDWFVQARELSKALRLATALRYFWRVRGHYREGSERLLHMLAQPEAASTGGPDDAIRARALNAAGYLQWVQGNTGAAQKLLQEALTLGSAVADAAATAFALRYLGLAADAQQDRATAQRLLEESLSIYRGLDAPNETALALMYLGDAAFGQQAYDQAQRLYQESADLLRQLGNNVVLPYALRHLGYLALAQGNHQDALGLCTESLRLNLAAGEQQGSAAALTALAAVAAANQQWVQAARLLECVAAWLAASHARLLPVDRTYYEQTERLLQQRGHVITNATRTSTEAPLAMAEALTYVVQELAFAAPQPEPREDKGTRGQGDKERGGEETNVPLVPSSSSLPVSPVAAPAHNLPVAATPLVGRSGSLAEISNYLQQAGGRLLTLVGPGGMGKTRLALEVGRQHLASYSDGVWFVPLASISTADALPGAIATALGITLQGSEPRQALLQSLSAQQLLLILDNYEHLLLEEAAVDLVVDLLARAPGVQILITSRQRLNLREEQLYPVQALTFPSTVTLAEATSASAVRLFVQAVQRVQADFQLTATNLPAVLRICQLVQGMPLGLELAAANAGSAPLRAIADALEQSAEILAVEWRDLPARQRSMRAVFAWSWQLLSAAEQRVLRQSARFRGGFDYTAAQAVIGATPALLTALANKSLLQWQARAPGEGRYAMHELLRQFAAEALAESGERAVVEERHGRYYLAYLAARGFRLGRSEPKEASAEIQVELDNVRLAWHWAATQGRLAELDQALYAWWQFCLLQGLGGEAQQSLAAALAGVRMHLTRQADDGPLRLLGTRLLAKLLALHANYLFAQGRDEEMAAQAREAMQLGAASGGFEGEILGSYVLGRVLQDAHQKREAQALWEQTIQLIQRYQPQQPENELLHELHWMAHIMLRGSALHFGDYAGCRAHIVEALRICQMLGKQRGELTCLSCLGEINFFLYDFAAAEADYRAELVLGRNLGYRLSEMSAQEGLARVARLRGDYATARTLFEQSLSTATELAFHYDEALFLAALIRLHCQLGDQTAAAACQERLTQLLAEVPLGKECRLYGYLAAAFMAHYAGDKDEALAAAEQANQINQQGGDILFRLVDTALILGHVRAAAGQWEAAQSAFQEALTAFQQFNKQTLSAEPQAGLAQIALAQGDRGGALAQIEALLPVLAQEPHAGYNDPIFIYLTGYRVLVANGDSRATTLLQQGYDLLHQDAAALDDASRQRFLAVPLHRDLAAAYAEMRAYKDKETRRQGDKEQASSEPPLSLSPPHLVTSSPLLDWAEMPAVDFFVERKVEVAKLTTWLTPTAAGGVSAQLISILGMGGMGKTTLAAAVTKAVAPEFAVVIWRSLINAPPLSELLHNWLQTLSRQRLPAFPESLDEQLRLLLTYLQQERCLLVLDNVESIFVADTPTPAGTAQPHSRAGVTRPGYEGYDQLFQHLANSDHQSCLLLTSREQPYGLLRSGRQAQTTGRLQVLPLAGLDPQAGYALLQSNGLHTSPAEAAQLIENYSGNPLALQIVAATIADFFGGDVAAFRQEDGQLFDGIRMVLDQQFARLSPLERDILVWLAVERAAVSVATLRANLAQTISTGEVLEALQSLQNRSLLDKQPAGLMLQNVIIEYTTDYLVQQVCQEIEAELRITNYELQEAVSDTELVNRNSKIVNLFLNRFALLKAQAKEYVRRSQSRLIVQPIITHLLDRLGRAGLEQRLRTLIGELRRQANPAARGYAVGNLLNLLLQAGYAVNELDLSHLTVWQAYLRECTLHNVNFSGADLRGSEFADTFTAITALTYSRDGKFLVAGTSLGDIRVWLAQTLQPIAMLQGHSRLIMGLAFGSEQSQLLASCGEDGTLRLWNMAKLEEPSVTLYKAPGFIRTVAVSPIADLAASAGDDPAIQLWNMQTRHAVAVLRGHSNTVTAVAFSADGRYLASCSGDHTVRLWDLAAIVQTTGPQPHPPVIENSRTVYTWSPAVADVWQITISPDNQWLAGVNLDGMVWTWQIDAALTEKPVQVLHVQGAHQMALTFSPDSSQLAVATLSGAIWLLDSHSGEIVRHIEGHKPLTLTLAFAPDGKTLASSGSDRTLQVWELPTGRSIQALAGAARAFRAAVFGADGETIVTSAEDHTIRIWEVSETPAPEIAPRAPTMPRITGFCRHVLRGHSSGIWTVALDHTGTVAASAGEDTNILLWDRSSGQQLHKLKGHLDTVTALAFSPDGRTLISGSPDQTVRLWDYRTFMPLAQLRDDSPSISTHEKSIWSVALSPDGALLAAGYSDGGIVIWDIRDAARCRQIGKLRKHEGWVRTLAFSPDGSLLASGSNDHTVRLWAVKTGLLQHILHGHSDWVMSVAFHPHDNLLASGSFDSTIRLWDVATGEPIAAPAATAPMRHDKGVVAVTFHPAGHLLLSASRDERMTFWHCATQQRLKNLVAPGPYAGLKITGATGLSAAQKAALRVLGAVDEAEDDKEMASAEPPFSLSPPLPVTPSPLLDWAEMPMVDFFVERKAEVAQLTAWLTPTAAGGGTAQLISILGMGGMGKTTLAAAVTKAVAPHFAVVIWRSLLNAPPMDELLRNWLQTLSRQRLTTLPESLDEQLRLLLTYLQQERCLLVLDNVESLFVADTPAAAGTTQPQSRAGVTRPGYEGYDQLFQRLASSDHQSCLLLTSREQPYALLRVAAGQGRQTQSPWRLQVLPLAGLDQAAGQTLLASNGLHASPTEAAQLIKNYSGNPLALQIVASTIVDFFGGDVAAFQAEDGQIFDGMRLVLDQQFARLSPLEREILVWLAIEREPVTVSTLRSNFVQPVATAPLLEALQALQNRSLLEKRDSGLTLQNVIIEYATEYLVKQVCQEIVEDMVTESPSLPWQGHPVTQSFLNRFALLKAQSKEYTRQSQERLILQPVAAHLRRHWEQRSVRLQVQQMLNGLREKGTRRGYAAGNLLNLLIHWGVELNGYDFSGLSVWQADLRRSTVQCVNLAQADLSSSAFTQTFSRIECVAISPDGQLLAAAGDGGAIRLFRLPNGEPHHLLSGHTNTITAVAFSPNGAYLASTGDDGLILLWTIPDGRLHRQLNAQMPMRVVVFSPDGRLLAGASRNGGVLLWQVESGHLRRTLPLHRQRVNALAFHPSGNLLASAGSDGAISLVEVSKVLSDANAQSTAFAAIDESQQGSRPVRTLVVEPEARFFAATFSPDGKRLVVGGGDGKLHVWDAPFHQRTSQTPAHQGEIRAVTFCADSRFLFSAGNDGVIRLWDSTDMHCCQALTGHKETVYALALGLQDRLMASGSEDASICLWEVNPQTQSILRQRMAGYPQALECVAWSGCGRWLATGDIHGTVRLWYLQAETPRCTQEIRGKSTVITLTFTPDGQQLAIGRYADPAGIELWAVRADDQWQLRSGYRIPTAGIACFSTNGSLLATSTPGGDIHLWNAQTLQLRAGTSRLTGHSSYVNRVAFTAEDQLIASCSNDLTVRLWHLATGEEILQLPGYGNNTCLALNAQGTLLACSSPNFGIALWHLADRTAKQPLHNLIGHTNEAFACAFSPDGNHLVSVGLDRSVRLWDVQTGVQRTLLGYHEQYALDVAFSPDGKQVATIGKEGALYLWQMDTYECLHQLHAPGPYADMNITGVTGISEAQKAALKALGAVEE